METGGKILTGAAATALLALVGHYATGDNFVSGLEESAQTELTAQGMEGVSATFSRDPLSRTAVLDGEASDEAKKKALQTVRAIPGVSGAHWKGEENTSAGEGDVGNTDTVDSGTQEQIAKCQGGIDKIVESKKLSFRSGSAYISPESNRILDEIAAALKPCAGLSIAVGGHTDNNGDASVNKIMSQERADRVRQGLIDRGIAETLITATGYGAEKPLAKSGDAAADAHNRRIEFKVQAAGGSAGKDDAQAQQEN